MTNLKSEVRSLEIAKRTAQALGIPINEQQKYVTCYYSSVAGNQDQPCDLVFGTVRQGAYSVGLQKQADGTYSFISDVYDVNDKAMLKKFGDDYDQWKEECRGGILGHVNAGTPNRFLQEYVCQAALLQAKARGMRAIRIPQENGDVIVRLTGGQIPVGAYVNVLARRDGSSQVSPHGVKGKSCLKLTDWARGFLGRVADVKYTKEYYMDPVDGVTTIQTQATNSR